MVAVKRSKGCHTCRKRHIKCDERHPSCARCERSDLNCEGFGKDLSKPLTFVSENTRAKRRALKQERLRANAFQRGKDSSEAFLVAGPDKGVVLSGSNTTPAKLWPELSFTAFKDEIQISFTLTKLFLGDARTVAWLGWGYNTFEQNINSNALKALSGVYYGRQHRDSSFENNGRLHYSKTLCGLSKAIESRRGMSLDVLLAAMTASCYEMIASPTYAETLLHASGVGKLIQLRGPERHRGMLELHILSTMRPSICIKAIVDKKRCFLEKEEWKTIPWSLQSKGKTMVTLVEDIMCNIPGLLEDYDALFASDITPETFQLRFENLEADISHHFRLLADWRAQWEQIYSDIRDERVPRFLGSPFPTVVYYQDLEAANGLMLYYALYIMISELGIRLLGPRYDCRIASTKPKYECMNPHLNLPGALLYDPAIEICRSMEFYFSPPHETAGAFFIIFPLKKANDWLPSGSAEQEWLKDTMMNLATRTGIDFLSTGVLSR